MNIRWSHEAGSDGAGSEFHLFEKEREQRSKHVRDMISAYTILLRLGRIRTMLAEAPKS